MNAFVRDVMRAMKMETVETENGDLLVHFDPASDVGGLLGAASPARLAFGNAVDGDDVIHVRPGCALLANIERLLAEKGSIRHVRLAVRCPAGPSELRKRHDIMRGAPTSFSARRAWMTTMRCFVKIAMIGEEAVEEIVGVEIPPGGPPRTTTGPVTIPADSEYIPRPMIRGKTFHDKLSEAMRIAEAIAVERAEDMRAVSVRSLYKSLERMRAYYRQVREETPREDAEGRAALESEYRRRRNEDIERSAVRIRLDLLAVETVAEPMTRIHWKFGDSSCPADVQALYSLHDGRMAEPVRCGACNKAVSAFGVLEDGIVACPECLDRCAACDADILRSPEKESIACIACGRTLCPECAAPCAVCGNRLCRDHLAECNEGFAICGDCVRRCPDCPPGTIWRPDRTVTTTGGLTVCRMHASLCAGCRELKPESRMMSCGVCGQTVCPDCREQCAACGAFVCLNHIEDRRCRTCRTIANGSDTAPEPCPL